MVAFLFVNFVMLAFDVGLYYFNAFFLFPYVDEKPFRDELIWTSLHYFVELMYLITIFFYLCTFLRNPGFTKKIEIRKFYVYLDKAIKENRNLDYFCFFCRTIWSSTGVHCV